MPKDLFEEHGIDLLSQSEQQPEEPGFFKKLGRGYLNYAGGALRGMGQAVGDLGASTLNAPISGLEYLSGHKIPHVPHPNLINEHPGSLGESVGQTLGQLAGGFALPGGAGVKAAQLAGKGYSALRAGKELPLIGKLLAGSMGGAAEGALGNEENRTLGAELGGLLGGAGQGVASGINLAKNIRSKNIAQHVSDEVARMNQHFSNRFESALQGGEEAGANKFLKGEKTNLQLLKKEGNAKHVYALEKFNENPTLKNAHEAQRDLAKIERKYKNSQDNKLETDIYKTALKTKNRLLQKISEAFEKSGAKEHGESYHSARGEYLTEAVPYLESPAIQGLLGRGKSGAQTVRPKEFADKLLKEESFLARAGERHPGLLQREKTKKILKHPVTKLGAVGAASYLPYEIQKLLGGH